MWCLGIDVLYNLVMGIFVDIFIKMERILMYDD